MATNDVMVAHTFWAELDGMYVAEFSEVSGLEATTKTEEFLEGGVNEYAHHIIKETTYSNIVLKRGLTVSGELWDWYNDVRTGEINRKNGSIILLNYKQIEVCRWNFYHAFPVKWTGPSFNANSTEIAFESIELVHNGFTTIYNPGALI